MHGPLKVKFVNAKKENYTFFFNFTSACLLYRKKHFFVYVK
jgi:hypothetical protein